jgi:hypothetical protein
MTGGNEQICRCVCVAREGLRVMLGKGCKTMCQIKEGEEQCVIEVDSPMDPRDPDPYICRYMVDVGRAPVVM